MYGYELYPVMIKILYKLKIDVVDQPLFFPYLEEHEKYDIDTKCRINSKFDHVENAIKIDIPSYLNGRFVISALMHECKHVDQKIHHAEYYEYYRTHKDISMAHYADGLNLIEMDAVLFGRYYGALPMDWIYKEYSLSRIKDLISKNESSSIREKVDRWANRNNLVEAWFSEEELRYYDSRYDTWISSRYS